MCQLRYRKDTEPLYNAFLAFRLYWNLFWLPMTSPTESFIPSFYTPLYKKEQNEREIIQWRLLLIIIYSEYFKFDLFLQFV